MISINFTLYRFVCDVTTLNTISGMNMKDDRISETSAFACFWSRVPRACTTSLVKPSGGTSMTNFKKRGSDMILSFSSTTGILEVDGDKDIISFELMPSSCAGESASVLAKGTVDPRPYLSKPSKNYAIKLRDAAGQVMGRLFFALEVSEKEEVKNADLGKSKFNGNALYDISASSDNLVPSNNRLSVKVRSDDNINHSDTKGGGDNGYRDLRSPNGGRMESQLPSNPIEVWKRVLDISSHPPQTKEGGSALTEPTTKPSVNGLESWALDIDLERVVVKSEAINLNNPAPLLLGGVYCLKVRFNGMILSAEKVECQSPKEIIFSGRVSFTDISNTSDKFRFSLWENERQVAGFSLNPTKFSVAPGTRKEYTIPFRYYPTQQAMSLEVAVLRTVSVREERVTSGQDIFLRSDNVQQLSTPLHSTTQLGNESEYPSRRVLFDAVRFPNSTSLSSHPARNEVSSGGECKSVGKDFVSRQGGEKGTACRSVDLEPRCYQSHDRKEEKQQQQQQYGYNSGCSERRKEVDTQTTPLRSWNMQEGCSIDDEASHVAHTTHNVENNVNRVQVLLDRLNSNCMRSSSLKRRPGQGPEVPSLSRNHSAFSHRGAKEVDSIERSGSVRDGTPLRSKGGVQKSSSFIRGGRGNVFDVTSNNELLSHCSPLMSSSLSLKQTRVQQSQEDEMKISRRASRNESVRSTGSYHSITNLQGRPSDSLYSRMGRPSGFRSSLMDEWLEWRESRASARASRTGSVYSGVSVDCSVNSIASRNRAASPLPTKSLLHAAEMKPYQSVYIRRSSSAASASVRGSPIVMR